MCSPSKSFYHHYITSDHELSCISHSPQSKAKHKISVGFIGKDSSKGRESLVILPAGPESIAADAARLHAIAPARSSPPLAKSSPPPSIEEWFEAIPLFLSPCRSFRRSSVNDSEPSDAIGILGQSLLEGSKLGVPRQSSCLPM